MRLYFLGHFPRLRVMSLHGVSLDSALFRGPKTGVVREQTCYDGYCSYPGTCSERVLDALVVDQTSFQLDVRR